MERAPGYSLAAPKPDRDVSQGVTSLQDLKGQDTVLRQKGQTPGVQLEPCLPT